jgi:hypothetical protein
MALSTFKADRSMNAVSLNSVSSSHTTYTLCANGSFSGVKSAGGVKLTTLLSVEFKNSWGSTSPPAYACMVSTGTILLLHLALQN